MVKGHYRTDEICYLCRSRDFAILSEKGRGKILLLNKVCKKCGLAQRSPRPTHEEVLSYYKNGTFFDENQDRNYERIVRRQYKNYLQIAAGLKTELAKYISEDYLQSKSFRILEVGSHCGAFLSACKEIFPRADISGVEPFEDIALFSQSKLGDNCNIHVATLEDFSKKEIEPYDIIISIAVLEHVYDPFSFMNIIRRLLKPNGFIFFNVPNMHSHSTGWPFWYDWYLKEHLFHFSAPTITRLFAQSGFLPLKIDQEKKLSVLAIKSDNIPQKALEAEDDYKVVLQSHSKFKRAHLFHQFTSPIRFTKFLLFLLLGHNRAFKILKLIKEAWFR